MTFAEIYLREKLINKKIDITSAEKPQISDSIANNWQRIINIISKILDVPSGLIMKINPKTIEVFLSSETINNPYEKGDEEKLKKGLYCETVIGQKKELLVADALNNIYWKDNPDVKLGMISYYGLPILWPDEEVFGTICVLDNKKNQFNEKYKKLIKEFKISIEKDLKLLMVNDSLKKSANRDVLTGIYNRRKCIDFLEKEINRSTRGNVSFSIALIDLDKFKAINDTYGHEAGDDLLKKFADLLTSSIRDIDRFCRWGGDEFVLICPSTDQEGIHKLLEKIRKELINKPDYFYNIDFSFGTSSYQATDKSYEDILSRADQKMYCSKKIKTT